MHRRAFAKSLAVAALIPSAARATEEPRVTRYVWGGSGDPPPLLVRGVVVAEGEDECADEEIFVLLGPSNCKNCHENYRARVTSMGRSPNPGTQKDFEQIFAKHWLYLIIPSRGPTEQLKIEDFDIVAEARLPVYGRAEDVLVVEKDPEGAQVRALAKHGIIFRRAVAIEGRYGRYLVGEEVDLTGWVKLPT